MNRRLFLIILITLMIPFQLIAQDENEEPLHPFEKTTISTGFTSYILRSAMDNDNGTLGIDVTYSNVGTSIFYWGFDVGVLYAFESSDLQLSNFGQLSFTLMLGPSLEISDSIQIQIFLGPSLSIALLPEGFSNELSNYLTTSDFEFHYGVQTSVFLAPGIALLPRIHGGFLLGNNIQLFRFGVGFQIGFSLDGSDYLTDRK